MEEIPCMQRSVRDDDQRDQLSHEKTLAVSARVFNLDCQCGHKVSRKEVFSSR